MRVLIITDVGAYGGSLRFFETLLSIHARQRIVTDVLISSAHGSEAVAELAERYGAKLHAGATSKKPATTPLMTPFHDYFFSREAIRSCQPDLVVISTATPGSMSVALYCTVPALYILHSYPSHRFRLLPRLYLGLGTALNNRVMTVSHTSADAISRNMGIRRDRISVVYNSCRPVISSGVKRESMVLTVGHLVPYKNPEGWLAVAERVVCQKPGVTFVWLGDGDLLTPLRNRVRTLNLSERIQFPGYVADTASWYARAQIYFQPSLLESHGIAVLEAMACRLPCVVSNAGGLPESVVDGLSGYICPADNVAGFSERIITLLDDPPLRYRMGEAGSVRASTLFAEVEQERKILALYESLRRKSL